MKKYSIKFPVFIIIIFILLIFLHYSQIISPLENLLVKTLAPLQGRVYNLGLKTKNDRPSQITVKEFQKIQERLNQLLVENSQLKLLAEENRILKKKLMFLEDHALENRFVLARVIGRDPNKNILVLDKGEKHMIKKGLPVIVNEGILVGKIILAEKNISKLLLITDSQSRVAAMVQNQDSPAGLVEGRMGLGLDMNLIPRDKTMKVDDLVITSGLEDNIPAGLIIGSIKEIVTGSQDLFQKVRLHPLISLDRLNLVAILYSP